MNQFIKTFLACLLAFVVANILIGVFFVMVLAGIGSLFSEKAVSVEPGSVLRIDLSERIVDSPSSAFGFGNGRAVVDGSFAQPGAD